MSRNSSTPIVIIGAGPYGLSLAAHLGSRGVSYRIFGRPLQMWNDRMPRGMVLKSDGFASNLTAGSRSFTLQDFCAEKGYPYHHTDLPVPIEHFIEYGHEFQRRMVPQLEEQNVAAVRRISGGFQVRLVDGEEIVTPMVVVAAGISCYDALPSVFEALPEEYISHASSHRDLSVFAGREVTVLGSGASALEMASILKGHGAAVSMVARSKVVRFLTGPQPGGRTFLQRLRAPSTPMGSSWRSWMAWRGPHVFRLLPGAMRRMIVRRHLGPEGGWSIRGNVEGKIPMTLGVTVEHASVRDGRVYLTLSEEGKNGTPKISVHETGHVIAATGYRVDIERLTFLGTGLRRQIASSHGAPTLNWNFQSSIPGLFFIGVSSAPTFGPLMRFACGAEYASTCLSWHLARLARAEESYDRASDWQVVHH